MDRNGLCYPLVNIAKTMERSTKITILFHGKSHELSMAMASSSRTVRNYQAGYLVQPSPNSDLQSCSEKSTQKKKLLSHVGETSTFICDDIFCFCKEQGSPIAISKTQLTHPRARFSLFLCHIAMENRNVLSSVNHRTIHGPSIPLSKVQFQYTKVHSYSIDSINPGT